MVQFRSDFLRAAAARGFIHQCTDAEALDSLAADGPIAAYIGFDCTADSLHIGSLVPIMLLRLLQRTGHKPIVLLGGGTTRIGDPSGRDEARQLLDDAGIARNMAGIRKVFERFLAFGDGPTDAVMVNNADWLDRLYYIPFLREIGRHFTINRMLAFESVKLRLEREQPLTFLEFNYMILQSYDFLELARRHGCVLQMGGSDQWGNIVSGVELARRIDGRALFGLTSPLITTASGAKMGKTAQGAIWLNAEKLSPYDYWQHWRNTDDADVGRFLRLFTDLPLDEITLLETRDGAALNEAKKVLASAATRLAHGEAATAEAEATSTRVFEGGGTGESLPTLILARAALMAGIPAAALFCDSGLAASKGEARRLIRGGGARLNGAPIQDEQRMVSLTDLDGEGRIKLSAGRKRHAVIRVEG